MSQCSAAGVRRRGSEKPSSEMIVRPTMFAVVILTLGLATARAIGQEQPPALRALFLPPVAVDSPPAPVEPVLPRTPPAEHAEAVDAKTPADSPPRVPEFLGDQPPIGSF